MKKILSYKNLSKKYLNKILELTEKKSFDCFGKILTCLFFDNSAVDKVSFESAMIKNKGSVISVNNFGNNESVYDTIYSIQKYCDIIISNHKENNIFDNLKELSVPFINSSDGSNNNPCKNISDFSTIYKHFNGDLDNRTIMFAGDILESNISNGLSFILNTFFNMKIIFSINKELYEKYQYNIKQKIEINDYQIIFDKDIGGHLSNIDILYMTRCNSGKCFIKNDYLNALKDDCIIMQSFPRFKELDKKIDDSSKAIYFNNSNDLLVKQAIIFDMLN